MTINVTAVDISRGCPQSSTHCPVARAIRRKVNTGHVRIGFFYVHVGRRKYKLPRRISDWTLAYDQGQSVRPVRFELL